MLMLIALLAVLALVKHTLNHRRGKSKQLFASEISETKSNNDSAQYHLTLNIFKKPRIMSNFHGTQQQMKSPVVEDKIDGGSKPTTIVFNSGDEQCCHEISDRNVKVICSNGTHDHGSSKVKLKNVVDYKWEVKHYPGHLIAVHIDGKHIAYVINVTNKISRVEGMVRVVDAQSGQRAPLIKGMTGEVLDLQFAHIEKEHILASIDIDSLFVHKIEVSGGNLMCNLLMKVEDPQFLYTPKFDKITWCPYINSPDDDEEDKDEYSQLIVWARGSLFQCFYVKTIVAEHGMFVDNPKNLRDGYLKLKDDALIITWVALSPDGSTLGVGSSDGCIRFYQVYMHEKEPRCLHQWKPHGGKPISSFFFLDNLTKNVSEIYWNIAVTAAVNNTEFKIWDCGSWQCLQTLAITTTAEEKPLRFIVEIDRTSSYLVVSNMEKRICYVLQIVNNCVMDDTESLNKSSSSVASSVKTNRSQQMPIVYFKSISEFPLSSGILSFSIVDAAIRRYKCANDNYLCEEIDDYDEEANSIFCVVVRMFIVQSKSMQECHILYQSTMAENADIKGSILYDGNVAITSKDSSVIDNIAGMNCLSTSNEETDTGDSNEKDLGRESEKSELNALEALLSRGVGNSSSSDQIANSTSSSIVTVAAAAAAAPSAIAAEKTDSRSTSPRVVVNANANTKNFSQLNLMTPDAFSSTTNDKKTPECVSSEVLNTILMLASVTGQAPVAKPENMNLLNLVNNKIIEDQEQQKMQLKQQIDSQKKFIAIDNNPGRDNMTSGGSSPSREVQEILSLQDYDKSSYNKEQLSEEQSETIADTTVPAYLDVAVEELESSAMTQPAATNWPKVPDMHKVATKHSAELQNAASLISQAVNASAGNMSSNHAPTLVNTMTRSSSNLANTSNNAEISEMNMKLNQLIELVKMQSTQISNLQTEVSELKLASPLSFTKVMNDFAFKLEMQLSKLMDQYVKRYENDHKKKLTTFLAGRDVQHRELRDSMMQVLNQYILTQLGEVVSKVITIETQRQLVPLLSAKFDQLQGQMQMDVTQKLSTFDLMLQDNIAQACKSKTIIDAFGKSVLVGVQGSLQAAFVESMSNTLIPAYEKSSQNMFKQLHEAFSVGIKEFIDQFNSYIAQLQPMHDSTADILNNFSGFIQELDQILLKHRNSLNESMHETRKDVKGMEILLSRQLQDTLRSELRKCFEYQTVALRSQANTPAPIYDLREAIKVLLQQGQINKAFHQALVANDLALVEYTMKHADHSAVFVPNCCLEQKVLLSLIQQISVDMNNHNEVKQNYLAEALFAIDPVDPITREHAPKVLQELIRNCQTFLNNNPKNPQASNVRMVMKATQSYKDQFNSK